MTLRPRSLSAKIVLLSVGISGVLALGLTAAGYAKAAQGLRARTATALAAESALTASLLESWMRGRQESLRALAGLRTVRRALETAAAPAPEDLEATDRALGDAAALAPEILSIDLADPAGKVIRSSSENGEGQSLSQREDVREALRGRSSIGVGAGEDGAPQIYFAVPVPGSNGKPIGVAAIRCLVEPLRVFVAEAHGRAGDGADGLLVDGAGRVVATSRDEVARLQPLPPELGALLHLTAPLGLRYAQQGNFQLGAAHPLKSAGWVYLASLPEQEAERAARELLRNALGSALIGLCVAGALALIFARRLTASIVRLTEVSARIVTGDLTQQIEAGSDDEVGLLAESFARMVEALRGALTALKSSAGALADAAVNLRATMEEEAVFISRQAASLQQTQVTAQEIKQTSVVAAQKAQAVLVEAQRAEEVGRAGEKAVERSVSGLDEIGQQAREVGERIQQLSASAGQIGDITLTVKDLADQSNMLALNAAIEAIRSGEHGKSFAVVAREIRSLADQSVRATSEVGKILDGLQRSIGSAVALTEQGSRRMAAGMAEVKTSGQSLRELSGMTRDHVEAVRQIAAAVGQQNAGIGQIFAAVTDQLGMMESVRAGLERTQRASEELRTAAATVSETLARYRL